MSEPHHISQDLKKEMNRLAFENQELKIKLNEIQKKVKNMMAAKDIWLKDSKNQQKRVIFLKTEKEVNELVNPKPATQATMNWLAQ